MTTTEPIHRYRAGDYVVRCRFGPIAAELIREFADATNDDNPIHASAEFARRRGYPDVVGPGPMLAAVISRELFDQLGPACLPSMRLTFRSPVLAGDELRFAVRVVKVSSDQASPVAALDCHLSVSAADGAIRADGAVTVVIAADGLGVREIEFGKEQGIAAPAGRPGPAASALQELWPTEESL